MKNIVITDLRTREMRDAREDLERFLGVKVFLDLWVKVKENWRDRSSLLSNFGYREDGK